MNKTRWMLGVVFTFISNTAFSNEQVAVPSDEASPSQGGTAANGAQTEADTVSPDGTGAQGIPTSGEAQSAEQPAGATPEATSPQTPTSQPPLDVQPVPAQDAASQPPEDHGPATQAVETTPPPRSPVQDAEGMDVMGRSGRKLRLGKALAAAGTGMWAGGLVLETIGVVMMVTGNDDNGFGLLMSGLVLNLLGPIPSVVAEKMVKNSVGQRNRKALGKRKGMSSGMAYGFSWAFTGLAIVCAMIPTVSMVVIGAICSVFGEVLRGVAAVGPLVRISRYSRKKVYAFSVAPILNARKGGMKGLAATLRF